MSLNFQVLYAFAVMFLSRRKIKSTFLTLADIYNASKNQLHTEFNQKMDFHWNLIFFSQFRRKRRLISIPRANKYHLSTPGANVFQMHRHLRALCSGNEWILCAALHADLRFIRCEIRFPCDATCVSNMRHYMHQHWISRSNFSILSLWNSLPFDRTDLIGYFVEVCYEVVTTYAYFVCNGSMLLLFFSICWHHQAFSQMFHHFLHSRNRRNKKRNDDEFLCHLIRFHISVKEWVKMGENNQLHSEFFFKLLRWFSVFFSVQPICLVQSLRSSWIHALFILCPSPIQPGTFFWKYSLWIVLTTFRLNFSNLTST